MRVESETEAPRCNPPDSKRSEDSGRSKDVLLHLSILKGFGFELKSDSTILDFGCGGGRMVREYRRIGFQAFGADVALEDGGPFLRAIPTEGDYRIPFADRTFDFVYSNSVLEHVRDLHSALSEIHRVMKPGGASLHHFPPRARPIEPHVFVPFGGIVRFRAWLLLWALLGVRNSYQKHSNFIETIRRNHAYLSQCTFYRSKNDMRRQIEGRFGNVIFADKEMIQHSYGAARRLAPLIRVFPFVSGLYGAFHHRCVFFRKPAKPEPGRSPI